MVDIHMSKQRLIMENWRRFLKESQQLNRDDMRLLYVDKSDGNGKAFNIVLYIQTQQNVKVIGGIDCVETESPCIPKTMMVATVYRDSQFAGQRLGDLLYDCGFYVAQSLGFGLTSDKEGGTKTGAKKHWKRFEAIPNIRRKQHQLVITNSITTAAHQIQMMIVTCRMRHLLMQPITLS